VLVPDTVMGAPERGLEAAEDAVRSRQDFARRGRASLGAGPMAIAKSRQGGVALPAVRPHDGPRRDMGLNEVPMGPIGPNRISSMLVMSVGRPEPPRRR
jgi:hypothetical protein